VVAWKLAIESRGGPSALVFTRQALPHQQRTPAQLENIARGGYVLKEVAGQADAVIMASGSEVGLAMAAARELSSAGVKVGVVSMPNPDLFLQQDQAYRDSVLPPSVRARVAVEAGVSACWARLVGDRGKVVGIDRFGASAPAEALFEHYGLTSANVGRAVRESLAAAEQSDH
jgi:transketolase